MTCVESVLAVETSVSQGLDNYMGGGTGDPVTIAGTITPTISPSLDFAWLLAHNDNSTGDKDMTDFAGYTTLMSEDYCSRTTHVIATRSEDPPSGAYTATGTFTAGFACDGDWLALHLVIQTDATSPVQDVYECALKEADLPGAPTAGNVLLMFVHTEGGYTMTPYRIEGGEQVPYAEDGWSELLAADNRSLPGVSGPLFVKVFARCVNAGDGVTYGVNSLGGYSTARSIYISEWAITGSGGTGIGDEEVGPDPVGTATSHTTDPTVNDDGEAGYHVGHTWTNTTTGAVFVLTDETTGAAVWTSVGAPTDVDYLVGTAQAGLSAEIVVGTTPGGELGGTWASPTVDATHSGSAHPLISTINVVIDGGGSAITTGVKGDVMVDFNCTINAWTLLADRSGDIVVDIWREELGDFPPTDADSMCSGKEPTIAASGTNAQDTTITDWTSDDIVAGDILRFNVDSCTTIQRATLALKVTRT
jgi:hypothetical protein